MSKLDRSGFSTAGMLALSCILPIGMLAIPRAQAQQASQSRSVELGEIVVTATKREVPLHDVPVAVSVLTTEDIGKRGFTEYGDYLNSLPGVYFADGGPVRSTIRIRNLGLAEGGGSPTLVATYFGETPTSVDGEFPDVRLVDIERVEVLRGPQGTLYGANSLSGAVRILPAQPDLEDYQVGLTARGFSTEHSDDSSYNAEGVVNLPLLEDRFALRLVGYQHDVAGYIDNRFTGQPAIDFSAALGTPPGTLVIPAVPAFVRRDVNHEDTEGARAAATWQATERLRFELGYLTQDSKLESEPQVTPSVGAYAQSRAMDVYSRGEAAQGVDVANLTVRYDWGAVSLTSASAQSNFDNHTLTDVTETAVQLFGLPLPGEIRQFVNSEAFTQELRLNSRGTGALQWLIGAFYLDRDNKQDQDIPDHSCPTCLAFLLGEQVFLTSNLGFKEEQRAVFGELSYDFSPRWTASAGGRYLEQDLTFFITDIDGLLAASQLDTNATGSASEFNPSFSLRFQPSDDLTLYAQAAKGFRTGQPNGELPAQCQAEAQARGVKPITDPDTLWNYEVGFKALLADGTMSFNAAVFDADWSGIQIGAGLACGFGALLNGGDATSRGVELEFVVQPSNSLRFNLAAAYNETEFGEVDPQSGLLKGERVPGSPKTNASAGVQYDIDLGDTWSAFARADYQYVGNIRLIRQGEVPRTVTQDAYGTGNVRFGFSRDNLALEFFARNVTDKRAVTSTGSAAFGSDQIIIRPRELGLELRYSYR
ncbi:MAG: TonB-dependent receptor [Steroidobacteraceae bacterium]